MVLHSRFVCIVALLCPGFCLAIEPERDRSKPLTEVRADISDFRQTVSQPVVYEPELSLKAMNAKIAEAQQNRTPVLAAELDLHGLRVKDWINRPVNVLGEGYAASGTVVAAFLTPETARATLQIRLNEYAQKPALGEATIRLKR